MVLLAAPGLTGWPTPHAGSMAGLVVAALQLLPALASAGSAASYSIGAATTHFPHHWEECVGSGHASLTLRADWRNHLTRARRDLGVKRTRFHGLLDDDFSMSLGDHTDSYVNLDSLIDFYDSLGMTAPLFELSFMPAWLATNGSAAATVTHYRGITTPCAPSRPPSDPPPTPGPWPLTP